MYKLSGWIGKVSETVAVAQGKRHGRLLKRILLQDLVKQAPAHTDVWAVDTACLVPVTLFKKSYAKAFAFRNATGKMREERLKNLPYPTRSSEGRISQLRRSGHAYIRPCCTLGQFVRHIPQRLYFKPRGEKVGMQLLKRQGRLISTI